MLKAPKSDPEDQSPVEIIALRMILRELQLRGHRLRHLETQAENETAPDLGGAEAVIQCEVCNEQEPQPN